MKPDQKIEHDHIIKERLGHLCGSNKPTKEQLLLAECEADTWLARDIFREREKRKENE